MRVTGERRCLRHGVTKITSVLPRQTALVVLAAIWETPHQEGVCKRYLRGKLVSHQFIRFETHSTPLSNMSAPSSRTDPAKGVINPPSANPIKAAVKKPYPFWLGGGSIFSAKSTGFRLILGNI